MSDDEPIKVVAIGAMGQDASEHFVQTPFGRPNYIVQIITPLQAILARAGNVFFQTLMGGIGAAGSGVVPYMTWKVALALATSAALVCVGQSLVTVFSNLEKRFPLLRA